ncbi:MAG: alkaline phosphatase [Campylobacter sp.]|nr:alkaline phosphatase [Campylobacter sp.]
MKRFSFVVASLIFAGSLLSAAKIYPLDRAEMLENARFDIKVEFDKKIEQKDAVVTINGKSLETMIDGDIEWIADEDGMGSTIWLRDARLPRGHYTVTAYGDGKTESVGWEIYDTPRAETKNLILIVGDGLTMAHRTAARLMSKGMSEGKADGRLNMDELSNAAFVGTSAQNSIATDSANTMSAYMTGQKTAVNAMGVFTSRSKDDLNHPKQTTLGELIKFNTKKSLGIISDAELEDATPAAVVAHTRRRAMKANIVEQMFNVGPDVILGGGSAYFLPQSTPGSKRKDNQNFVEKFKNEGYKVVTTAKELQENYKDAKKLLGLFHLGNMDTVVDRKLVKNNVTSKFPDQPDLTDMTRAALEVLSKNEDGFVLMVESAHIDKASHPLDWERAVMSTIMMDQVLGIARDFQKQNPDTLIVMVGDHTHAMSVVGTIDDRKEGKDMREKVGVYEDAGFLEYEDKNFDGYPDKLDIDKRLYVTFGSYPDHYQTYRPKLDRIFTPAIQNENKEYIANEEYKNIPGAIFVEGNLPRAESQGVHAVDDMVLQADGPGADKFSGYMDNTEVFRHIVKALGIAVDPVTEVKK